ncbi:MAG: S-methyl-5'-thioadenosine phosphorylase [Candidatus Methanofastidiosa archaeon]|nr:S-methyl-5'-thioadenosine phosphorylase [Candidatus Methanofastidiosa archaeon]
MIGIIGGSGIYDPEMIEDVVDTVVRTPYGDVDILRGCYSKKEVAFLPRHGRSHGVPPHIINYRANIWALRSIGVDRIFSTSASGSINTSINPGSFVVLSNFIDFTKGRPNTFYDGPSSLSGLKEVVHIDVTEPYCPELRRLAIEAGKGLDLPIVENGVYVCTEGPRFETAAEIEMFSRMGGDVVGMTNVPEVVLARELEICYCSIALVTNYAAGISGYRLTHKEVLELMEKNKEAVGSLFMDAIPKIPQIRKCECKNLLQGAKSD